MATIQVKRPARSWYHIHRLTGGLEPQVVAMPLQGSRGMPSQLASDIKQPSIIETESFGKNSVSRSLLV
jgi:hypothetical protein